MTDDVRRGPAAGRSRGFSLIELLVAVLVMGIGVLGVTALQMVSLQNNRAALVRAEAVQLAYNMMDRIRANPAGAPPGSAYAGLDIGDGPPTPPGSYCRDFCSADDMVSFDQAVWKCQLGGHQDDDVCQDLFDEGLVPANAEGDAQQSGLPEGDGAISINGGLIQITVQWRDPDGSQPSVVIDSQS